MDALKIALVELGVQFGESQIKWDMIRDYQGKLTSFKNGNRFVYIAPPDQPLPEKIKVAGTHTAFLQYKGPLSKEAYDRMKDARDRKSNQPGYTSDSDSEDEIGEHDHFKEVDATATKKKDVKSKKERNKKAKKDDKASKGNEDTHVPNSNNSQENGGFQNVKGAKLGDFLQEKSSLREANVEGDDKTRTTPPKLPPKKKRKVLKIKKPAVPTAQRKKDKKKEKIVITDKTLQKIFPGMSLSNFFQKTKPVNSASVSCVSTDTKCQAMWHRKSDCIL